MKRGPAITSLALLLTGLAAVVAVLVFSRARHTPAPEPPPRAIVLPSSPPTIAANPDPPSAPGPTAPSTTPAPPAAPPDRETAATEAARDPRRRSPPQSPAPPTLSTGLPSSAPAGDPAILERALASHTRAELGLLGTLARADVAAPPAVAGLFQLHRQGAPPDELRRYVRTSFPKKIQLRLLTMQWINNLDPLRPRPVLPAPPTAGPPLAPIGRIRAAPRP